MLRFFYIVGILVRYLFFYILLKLHLYSKSKPKLIRSFFEEAGGSFIKFGQLLALRADVLPKEYSLELLDLFDNIKPFPYSDVVVIFLEELGATPEKIFKDFQKEPFASASFGQVHGAKLENDHIVAVKILRPGIEDAVMVDFFVIDILAFLADLFFKIDALPWKEFASEFKKWTKKELDYRIEAENITKMHKNTSVNKNIVVPNVYLHLSTQKILVEDYIEGIPLSRVLRGLKDGRLIHQDLEKMGIDIKKVPVTLTQELLRQFFMDDVFHADPHPGNILLLKNGQIALLDFGIIGESKMYNRADFLRFVESSTRTDYVNFKEAIYHFAHFSSEELKTIIGSSLPATTSEKQLKEIINLLSTHFAQTVLKFTTVGRPLIEEMKKDYTVFYLEIIKAGQRFKVKLPTQAVVFIRLLSIIGLLSKQLDNTYKLGDEFKYFFKIHPLETLIKEEDHVPLFKRINREKAIEKLNGWLSYLVEIDPPLYQLVKEKFKEYNAIDN